jgi:hypothetical protein
VVNKLTIAETSCWKNMMALVHFVLNPAAISLFKNESSVRIRTRDDNFQLRPTSRKSETNLPKGERLRPIIRSTRLVYFSIKEDFFEDGQFVLIRKDLYGWNTIIYVEEEIKVIPCARLLVTLPTTRKF